MSRRAAVAVGVLVLWLGGLAVLLQRELFRPDEDRLTEAALRVNPGAMYYAALRDGQHVGYASSTVDTLTDSIRVADYLVADLPVGNTTQRVEARSEVLLSRALRLQSFTISVNSPSVWMSAEGQVDDLTRLRVVSRATPSAAPDTQVFDLDGPVLLPTIAPLAAVLARRPVAGQSTTSQVFDPVSMSLRKATLRVAAETLFVIPDSAVFDPRQRRWTGAIPIRTRAWRLESDDPAMVTGWVDEQGRMVRWSPVDGLTLERMPHEMAFENWRSDTRDRSAGPPPAAAPAHPSRFRPAAQQ